MAKVTLGVTDKTLDELITSLKGLKCEIIDHLTLIGIDDFSQKTKIMINGNWVAFTDNPLNILNVLKNSRRKAIVPDEVSIVHDILQREIKIYTDSGRCMRPLFTV